MATHSGTVVTHHGTDGSILGDTIDICGRCEAALRAAGRWPRTATGDEYATVQHGLHGGTCSLDAQTLERAPAEADDSEE